MRRHGTFGPGERLTDKTRPAETLRERNEVVIDGQPVDQSADAQQRGDRSRPDVQRALRVAVGSVGEENACERIGTVRVEERIDEIARTAHREVRRLVAQGARVAQVGDHATRDHAPE